VCEPDEYLCQLFDAWPDEVLATLVRVAGEKRRPPMTSIYLAMCSPKPGFRSSPGDCKHSWTFPGQG
jgi:hypothetical protein